MSPDSAYYCPTALVKSEGKTKGIPVIGHPKELYSIDRRFVANLVTSLNLDIQYPFGQPRQ